MFKSENRIPAYFVVHTTRNKSNGDLLNSSNLSFDTGMSCCILKHFINVFQYFWRKSSFRIFSESSILTPKRFISYSSIYNGKISISSHRISSMDFKTICVLPLTIILHENFHSRFFNSLTSSTAFSYTLYFISSNPSKINNLVSFLFSSKNHGLCSFIYVSTTSNADFLSEKDNL